MYVCMCVYIQYIYIYIYTYTYILCIHIIIYISIYILFFVFFLYDNINAEITNLLDTFSKSLFILALQATNGRQTDNKKKRGRGSYINVEITPVISGFRFVFVFFVHYFSFQRCRPRTAASRAKSKRARNYFSADAELLFLVVLLL